jgi:hypothetical protein
MLSLAEAGGIPANPGVRSIAGTSKSPGGEYSIKDRRYEEEWLLLTDFAVNAQNDGVARTLGTERVFHEGNKTPEAVLIFPGIVHYREKFRSGHRLGYAKR